MPSLRSNPFIDSVGPSRVYGRVNRSSPNAFSVDEVIQGGQESGVPNSVTQRYFRILFLFVGVLISLLTIRTFSLQVVQGAERLDQAENNRIRTERIPAMRGLILDRNGEQLVKNVPSFSVVMIPIDLPEKEDERNALLAHIGKMLEIPFEDISSKLTDETLYSRLPIEIAERVPYTQAAQLITEDYLYPGIEVETIAAREYDHANSTSHILGYVGKISDQELEEDPSYSRLDYTGKTGLEKYYEDELRGRHGYRQVERDHLNREKRLIASQDPSPGKTLRTSIDIGLQNRLQDALNESVDKNNASGGAAVALDPRTGNVLAMVSSPGFDANAFSQGISVDAYSQLINDPKTPLLNRAISGEYPSGSTIKPVIAAAALEEGIVTPQTIIQSSGGIRIDKWYFPDWKAGGHGPTNLAKAIADSVNTYFYTIGGGDGDIDGLGIDRLNEYTKRFGFDQRLGIDLPNEADGFLPTPEWKEEVKDEPWYIGDTYHYAIGQGDVLVTPLQIANATAAIANGGTLYRPQIAMDWLDAEGNLLSHINPEVLRQNVVSASSLKAVREGMRLAVTSGSAVRLNSMPVAIAAKTGTAQFSSTTNATHAWFTSFAPYENPEIVITVMVEKGGEGHAAALLVAQAGYEEYFANIEASQ